MATTTKPNEAAAGCLGLIVILLIAGWLLSTCSSSGGDKEPAKAAAPEVIKAQAGELWDQLKTTVGVCDAEGNVAATALGEVAKGRLSVVDAYGSAKDAQASCESAWMAIGDLKPPPGSKGEQRKAFADALESCSTAYFVKQEGFKKIMAVLDGDTRASTLSDLKDTTNQVQAGSMICIAKFATAADQVGFELPELTEAKAKADAKK